MQESSAQFRTKREQAVARVKDAIMLGRYRPGQLLRQVQLMADLDLGATPAREAALELAARGLLVHESRRGVRVAGLDPDRVAQVYQVRALVESEAARLSTLNATDAAVQRVARHAQAMEAAFRNRDLKRLSAADGRFHRALYHGAGNPVLQGVIENLWEQFPRYMLWGDPGRVMQSIAEHRGILQKFTRRDAAATASAVRQHILHGLDALRALLVSPESAMRVRA